MQAARHSLTVGNYVLHILYWFICARDPEVISSAIFSLGAISEWPDGVAALAAIQVFEELQELDHSLDVMTRIRTCPILSRLARYNAIKTDSA
jgi:vesicle coat complex subunit